MTAPVSRRALIVAALLMAALWCLIPNETLFGLPSFGPAARGW